MSHAVKTLQTGDTATTGTVIPPVLGAVDIWDGIWAAAPHHGQTDRFLKNHGDMDTLKPWETWTVVQPDLSTGDPHITFGPAQWMVAQGTGQSGDCTFLVVLDVRSGSRDTIRFPGGLASNNTGKWSLWIGSLLDTGVSALGKAVHVFVRRAGTWEVWRNGVKEWSADAGTLTDQNIGLWPRTTTTADQDFYQARYASRALTDEQIVAASADARVLHGI